MHRATTIPAFRACIDSMSYKLRREYGHRIRDSETGKTTLMKRYEHITICGETGLAVLSSLLKQ